MIQVRHHRSKFSEAVHSIKLNSAAKELYRALYNTEYTAVQHCRVELCEAQEDIVESDISKVKVE